MKQIPIHDGNFAIVDDDIYELFKDRKWYRTSYGYVCSNAGFGRKGRRTEVLHRQIMGKAPKGYVIDHVNCDPLDNRRDNLRFVSRRINNLNSRVRKNVVRHQGAWRVRFKLEELEVSVSGIKTQAEAVSIAALLRGSLIYHEMIKGG